MSFRYTWWLDAEAYAVLRGMTRGRRALLERCLDRLAAAPFTEPDFIAFDADGSDVFHVFVRDHVVVYHVDHAVRRVLVFEIYRAD